MIQEFKVVVMQSCQEFWYVTFRDKELNHYYYYFFFLFMYVNFISRNNENIYMLEKLLHNDADKEYNAL